MNNSSKFFLSLTLGLFSMLLLYIFVTRHAASEARELWFNLVIRPVAQKKEELQSGAFLLGLYRPEIPYDFERLYRIQEGLEAPVKVVSFYQAWGYKKENQFPLDICRNLSKGDLIPMITWEPWVTAFEGYQDFKDSSLALISKGTFDTYIRKWARDAVRYGKPFFLRPGHEMSNDWYSWSAGHGNSPQDYRKFWNHVRNIFREQGAGNVAFVWNPFVSADTVFYPGNDAVDWVGLDIFNFGSFSIEGTWLDFYTITKILYDQVKRYNKPVLIAETGSVSSGGSKENWYRDMFHYLAVGNFPLISGLVFFDSPNCVTPTGISVDLEFSSIPDIYNIVNKREIGSLIKKPEHGRN